MMFLSDITRNICRITICNSYCRIDRFFCKCGYKMKVSPQDSERIRAISFVCALMVVAIHCSSIPKGWWDGSCDMPAWIVGLQTFGTDTLSRLAVPWFFVVSGFFLVKGLDLSGAFGISGKTCCVLAWWKHSVLKRVLTLGVPYLLWNLIYYLFKLSTGKYSFDMWHCLEQLTGCDFYDVPACGQLWYLRCVFFYVLCAPVFVALFYGRVVGPVSIVALLFCWLVGIGLPIKYMQIVDFSYIMYFGVGVYFGLGDRGVGRWLQRLGFVPVVILGITVVGVMFGSVFRNLQVYHVSSQIMIIAGLPSLWVLGGGILALTSRWKRLYGLSFFVYAMHVILVSLIYKVVSRFMPPMAYESIGYILKIVVGMLGSIAIGQLLGRFMPRVLRVLCGGRG